MLDSWRGDFVHQKYGDIKLQISSDLNGDSTSFISRATQNVAGIGIISESLFWRVSMPASESKLLFVGHSDYACNLQDIEVMIAFIKIAQEIPDCFERHSLEEIGRFLLPIVDDITHDLGYGELDEWSGWMQQVTAVKTCNQHELHIWLGQNIAKINRDNIVLFNAVRHKLERLQLGLKINHFSTLITEKVSLIYALSELESRIVALATSFELSMFEWSYLDVDRPTYRMYRAIAAAIDSTPDEVISVFKSNGNLIRTGILKNIDRLNGSLANLLGFSQFGHYLYARRTNIEGHVFDGLVEKYQLVSHNLRLAIANLATETKLIHKILKSSLENSTAGINILLSGAKGAGQHSFISNVLEVLHFDSYSIPKIAHDGEAILPINRARQLDFVQRTISLQKPSIFIVEEAEQLIFNQNLFRKQLTNFDSENSSNSWIRQYSKTNQHPVIWLCESPEEIDPIVLDSFTMLIHFDHPDFSMRHDLISRVLSPVGITEHLINAIAQNNEISPELVSASARTAELARGYLGSQDEIIMCQLKHQSKLMNISGIKNTVKTTTRFDLSYLHIEGSFGADRVLEALVRNGSGTMLLSGLPGTGKTQFARIIADQLRRELICLTAADINTKWYGESEKKVAKIFNDCRPQEQIIFIDEAEVLLSARDANEHRAANSVTAEFLRQLDVFPGIFICATNHVEQFDGALIRRFTFRLKFKPLTNAQRENLFVELVSEFLPDITCGDDISTKHRLALSRLDGLTPGDFSNVKRRFSLLCHNPSVEDWILELSQEWFSKPDKRAIATIGFI